MTKKQIENYNKMLFALKRIARGYDSSDKIIKNAQKEYGLDGEEALEYAYDNIQSEAKNCIKGIRPIKSEDVPTEILCKRLDEIVEAITASDYGKSLLRECTMRVPAEVDRDADLVLSEVARRLREHAKEPTNQQEQAGPTCAECGTPLEGYCPNCDNIDDLPCYLG